jgi:hypothetical protein
LKGQGKQSALLEGREMAATLEQLERRLEALEMEVRDLRSRQKNVPVEETAAQRGERLIREAKASQPAISAGLNKLLEQLGVPLDQKPISMEELHQQMIAEGINPEDCILSREIIRMRDE